VIFILLLGLLLPIFGRLDNKFGLPYVAAIISIVFFVNAEKEADVNADRPVPDSLAYFKQAKSDQAFWFSSDLTLDSWTQNFFPINAQRHNAKEIFGEEAPFGWVGSAPELGIIAPSIDVLTDKVSSGIRHVDLRFRSNRNAPKLLVTMQGADVLRVQVQNYDVSEGPENHWTLVNYGTTENGLNVSIQIPADQSLDIEATDISYGLPLGEYRPRPPAMMSQPSSEETDTTEVLNGLTLRPTSASL